MMAFLGKDRCGFFVFGLLRDTQKSVDDLEEGEMGRGRSRDKNIFCLIEADCRLLSGRFALKGALSMRDA